MRLILITPEKPFPGEDLACRALFDAGLELLHLRKPSLQRRELATYLAAIPVAYHDRIVLHDHFSLAGKNIKRIHLNSRNPVAPANKELIVSCSCHSLEEVTNKVNKPSLFPAEAGIAKEQAVCTTLNVDTASSFAVPGQAGEQGGFFREYEYLFLSPIFNSISKDGYRAAFSEEQLQQAYHEGIINPKVIALGGIGKENITKVAAWGFGGVALIGNVWGDYAVTGDIHALLKRYNEIQTICNSL